MNATVTDIPDHPLVGTTITTYRRLSISGFRKPDEEKEEARIVRVHSVLTCLGESLMGFVAEFTDGQRISKRLT